MEYLSENEFNNLLKKLQKLNCKEKQLDETIKLYLDNKISLKELKSFCLYLEIKSD